MIELDIRNESDLVAAIGAPAMLEQTAEESVEFAHACLKYARHFRCENPTHKEVSEMYSNLHEECADILLCISQLLNCGMIDPLILDDWERRKVTRMNKRLSEDNLKKEG